MPLEKLLVPGDLSGGIDTKTDEKMVLPSSLLTAENAVFTKGSVITKRFGYSSLGKSIAGSTSISSGDALTRFQNELLLFSSSNLYSYSSGRDEWIDKGGSLSVTIESDDVIRNDYEQSAPAISYGNGVYCIAWEDTEGGVRASVLDAVSGAFLQNNTSISTTGKLPRCIELNGVPAIVYIETSDNDVDIQTLKNDDPTTFNAAVQLASNAATSGQQLDAIEYAAKDAIFAYRNSSSQVQVAYITQDGVVGSGPNGYVNPVSIANDPKDSISIFRDPNNDRDIYVAYSTDAASAGLKVSRMLFDLTVFATYTVEGIATVIPRVTIQENSTSGIEIIYEHNASADYDHLIKKATYSSTPRTGTPSMGAGTVLKRSVGLASQAFYYNSKTYVCGVHASGLQPTFFLMDTTGLVVGKIQQGVAGGLLPGATLPRLVAATAGIYKGPFQIKTRLVSADDDVYSLKGLTLGAVDFTQAASFMGIELGENMHIAGGFISSYDTQDITEHGFHLYPENVSAGSPSSGGALDASKTYQWRCVFTYTDARGQIHRSAPSVAVTKATTSSNKTIALTIPTLRITEHPNVTIVVYRTVGDGTVFYRCGTVANSTTVDTVTFTDAGAVTDTGLLTAEILYTEGGIVENVSPPATSVLGTFNNRLFSVSSENPKILYYSKKRQAKQPVEFSDVFRIVMNKAVKITGLMEMDEKLIIFEEQNIYYLTGDGPTDAGAQNSFSEPQLVTGDVGSTNADALVLTPDGIMFMSTKGIYLLTRALETTYIGAPVEAYNAETVSSAVMLQDVGQVRFTTEAGACLVYDLYYRKWSTFSNHEATGAIVWRATGEYCYLRTSGGTVYKQATSYTDVGAPIQLKLVTAWIKPGSVQGYQRVKRVLVLGDYKSNHTLQTRVGYNFQDYFNEVHKFNFIDDLGVNEYGDESPYGSEIYGAGTLGAADGVYQFRFLLEDHQKCNAVRFEFSDTVGTDPGQAYSIANLMLEIGRKPTPFKLPSYKSI